MRFPHLFRALVLGGAAMSGVNCDSGPTDGSDPNQILQQQGNGDGGSGGGTAKAQTGTGGGHVPVKPGEGGAGSW